MFNESKILLVSFLLVTLASPVIIAQPAWVTRTPAVASTGPLSITMNYGINQAGTVYIIVYNFNNTATITSSTVRTRALGTPSGTLVETAVLNVTSANAGRTLQTILDVKDPGKLHTIYIVAANSKGTLQANPVKLTATTLPCPQADAGTGGEECDRNFVLNAVPALSSGIWTKVSGPGNASFSPNARTATATVTVTANGSYVFRWTETQGSCSSYENITVVFRSPPVANAGTGGTVCGPDFDLRAAALVAGTTGTWTMKSGTGTASFSPGTDSPSATVTVSEYGTKVFTWTVTNGYCSAASDVSVEFVSQPAANAGADADNCGREYYLMAVPSIGTGTWTRVSGPGSASFSPNNHDPQARVTVTAYGTYVFRWTEVNGSCTSNETVSIGFFQQLGANAGNGGDECDLNFNLNAVPATGATGTWSRVSGPGTATFSPNAHQYNAVVTVSTPGSYDFEWREVNNSCTSSDIIRVTFHTAPSISAGPDVIICRGSSTKLQAQGNGAFLWAPSATLNNPAIADPVATPVLTTIYTVRLTDTWGCTNTDAVTVTVRNLPAPDAGNDIILDNIFETQLSALPLQSFESGEWIVLTGSGIFSDKNSGDTRVSGLSSGENILTWNVTNYVCPVSSDTLLVTVRELVIPTMITPNLDGRNDFFVIRALQSIGPVEFEVFNRWGASVFKSENYNNDWDGKDYDGNLLQDDTYYYQIIPQGQVPIKGFIVIKR